MSDPVWYYARGEVERGPFTVVQIKALANAGRLRRDDLVWKEGMENWTSAAEVAELFPTSAATAVAEEPATADLPVVNVAPTPRAAFADSPRAVPREVATFFLAVGRSCLVAGLCAVVLAKGCESLGERKVDRHDAAIKMQAIEDWQQKRAPLAQELDALQAKKRLSATEQDRVRELNQSLKQVDLTYESEGLTAAQQLVITRANAEFREGAFLRGLTLHGGIVFLLAGGFALAMVGSGSDRWLGVGILLLVCFASLST